jgi:hypothetical protein
MSAPAPHSEVGNLFKLHRLLKVTVTRNNIYRRDLGPMVGYLLEMRYLAAISRQHYVVRCSCSARAKIGA